MRGSKRWACESAGQATVCVSVPARALRATLTLLGDAAIRTWNMGCSGLKARRGLAWQKSTAPAAAAPAAGAACARLRAETAAAADAAASCCCGGACIRRRGALKAQPCAATPACCQEPACGSRP